MCTTRAALFDGPHADRLPIDRHPRGGHGMLRNGLEPWHVIIVLAVALLVFGSKRLPDVARSLGRSARVLKSEARALRAEDTV
ncbi:predicted protein [Streptomyces sp. C]|nr:predicted protein [Streptomyces sp. C]